MKGKPDLGQFKPQKDPTAFLDGGAADRADKPPKKGSIAPQPEPNQLLKPEPTVQKLFRLRWDTANALRLGVAQQSITGGKRVTETEIVESLLRQHYGLDG